MSATEAYRSGLFDATLLKMLAAYDEVMDIILPTLGPERRATYSPFLPISPVSGKVLQVPMLARDVAAGTITYLEPETGEEITTAVTGGRVKCQWKADWALRWVAMGVDYEMAGKDLIDSVTLSSRICKALGGRPPEGFNYELFLDETGPEDFEVQGQRAYHRRLAELCVAGEPVPVHVSEAEGGQAPLFRCHSPRGGRVLPADRGVCRQDAAGRLANPVWHITRGSLPTSGSRSRSPCC
jgi:lysyl-tRNA synthetase class 1